MINKITLINNKISKKKLATLINKEDICYLLYKDDSGNTIVNGSLLKCKMTSLGANFHKVTTEIKKSYIKLFGNLSQRYSSLEWWGSYIASRNCSSTPLQLNITYLFCAKKIIEEFKNNKDHYNLVFIVKSDMLLHCIEKLCKNNYIALEVYYSNFNSVIKKIKTPLTFLMRISAFFIRGYWIKLLANIILDKTNINNLKHKKLIIIRSWITNGTLHEEGNFEDRNFGKLPEYFKSKGDNVVILPMFFNIGNSIINTFKLLKQQNIKFLIPERYFTYSDYFKALHLAYKYKNIKFKNIILDGIDVTMLFDEVKKSETFCVSTLNNYLTYQLFKKLNDINIDIKKVYYPFECNPHEKTLILGCKKYNPKSEIIGFQHSAWFDNQFGMFISKDEINCHPIADKIITSGSDYKAILTNAGFPAEKIIEGPNLRFKSVNIRTNKITIKTKRPNILIPLTFNINLAYDAINKISELNKIYPGLFIYIRRHPLLDYNELDQIITKCNITNYKYADIGNIQDWLTKTDLVISSGASIVDIETAAMGVPLLRIIPDNYFFLDSLASLNYPIKSINSTNDIIKSIKNISKNINKKELELLGSKITRGYFTKPNNHNMRVFV